MNGTGAKASPDPVSRMVVQVGLELARPMELDVRGSLILIDQSRAVCRSRPCAHGAGLQRAGHLSRSGFARPSKGNARLGSLRALKPHPQVAGLMPATVLADGGNFRAMSRVGREDILTCCRRRVVLFRSARVWPRLGPDCRSRGRRRPGAAAPPGTSMTDSPPPRGTTPTPDDLTRSVVSAIARRALSEVA